MKAGMAPSRTQPLLRAGPIRANLIRAGLRAGLLVLLGLTYGTTSCKYKSHHCIDSNNDGVCDDHSHHATSEATDTPTQAPARPLEVHVLEISETGETTLLPAEGVRAWALSR